MVSKTFYRYIWLLNIMKKRKKDQNRSNELAKKCAVESLKFLTHYGLKKMGYDEKDVMHEIADAEIGLIAELDITRDILDIKDLAEGVKRDLGVEPAPEKGDFCGSAVATALGFARTSNTDIMEAPANWQEMLDKKLLSIYYPEVSRNSVADWTKSKGYNTSTHLSRPIVKFKHIYVVIERTRT